MDPVSNGPRNAKRTVATLVHCFWSVDLEHSGFIEERVPDEVGG